MELCVADIERYSRQLILPNWSEALQIRLGAAPIAVSCSLPSCALYLAAAGIRHLRLLPDTSGTSLTASAETLRESILALDPAAEVQCCSDSEFNAVFSVIHLASAEQLTEELSTGNNIILLENECEVRPHAAESFRIVPDRLPFALPAGTIAASLLLKALKSELN